MAAGIPGVGVGGLFYVLSAVLAPVCELQRVWKRRRRVDEGASRRAPLWRQSLRLFLMAAGIVGAMWLTGLLVGSLMQALSVYSTAARTLPLGLSIWKISALALGLGTLTLVLGAVQIARLTVGTARVRSRAAAHNPR